jgi:hypothetical protein
MSRQQAKIPDAERSYLRSAVTAVDCEISRLAQVKIGEPSVTTDRLKEKWKELIGLLALGPEPEYRECPFCHGIGMRFASQCGYCWKKLPPFMSPPEAPGKRREQIC